MENTPLVSVIVISWNSKSVLRHTLENLKSTDYGNYEIIVVDNGSQDGTPEMIEMEFNDVKLIRLPQNYGILARNIGFKNAKGKYIFLLDDDSYPKTPDVIQKVVNYFESDASLGVVACLIEGGIFTNKHVPEGKDHVMFFGGGAGIRREVFEKVGYYDGDFFHYDNESDFALRVLDADYKIGHFKDIVVCHEQIRSNLPTYFFYTARNFIWIILRYFPWYLLPLLLFRAGFWLTLWGYKRFGLRGVYFRQKGIWFGLFHFWTAIKKRRILKNSTIKLYIEKKEILRPIFNNQIKKEEKVDDCAIKKAEKSDFKALRKFYEQCAPGELAQFLLKKWFDGKDPEGIPIFATNNNNIIGAGYIRICGKKFGLFTSWLVHPEWRKKGVASEMDKLAFGLLNHWGIERARIFVDAGNYSSLGRLSYLKKSGRIKSKNLGSIISICGFADSLVFPNADRFYEKVHIAEEEDEFELWWFLRLSPEYYTHKVYGEDKNFHFLDKQHFKKLIESRRIVFLKKGFLIRGLAIINKESLLSGNGGDVFEICFVCGSFFPIVKFIARENPAAIIRAYALPGQVAEFIKIGFCLQHRVDPKMNAAIYKVFSYKRNCW